ncbi:MAG: redox-regulated ATPase YchF [Dehalococcoidales bacterium]|jgi:GTP-binding protein YchF|nr:redox-regulated ATPase YchF [Dehalococcoidales bacterium]
MTIEIGIVGLAQSGKTTVFNALTGGKTDTRSLAPHIGIAKVPEPRLQVLADMLHPKKVIPAEVSYIDIGASVKELGGGKGVGGQILNQLSNADALINVIRAFIDETVPHIEGSLDVERDIATANLELTLHDLGIISRRLEKIEESLKAAKPAERQCLLPEQQLLARLKVGLEKELPVREMGVSADEARLTANYQFLTAKPRLIVVNIGEEQIAQAAAMEEELNSRYARAGSKVITLCGELEMELTQLDDEAAKAFRAEYCLPESGLESIIKLSYELLGLISFFTTVSEEMKAWSIPRGTTALKAAGKIHSDMERGFIRAEVISYDDLLKCGTMAEAHRKGLLRLEGKGYTVQDGDVITFLFNV